MKCPACGSTALATGEVEAKWHYEQDGYDGFIPRLETEFYAETLECSVCGLKLDDVAELTAAGLERHWEIEVDPERYIDIHDDYEPDEDYYRNR